MLLKVDKNLASSHKIFIKIEVLNLLANKIFVKQALTFVWFEIYSLTLSTQN